MTDDSIQFFWSMKAVDDQVANRNKYFGAELYRAVPALAKYVKPHI